MDNVNFISQDTAAELIGHEDVSFVDASWYLPAHKRDGFAEFLKMRIPGAVYFDINSVADKTSSLPHMLPDPKQFAQQVSLMGISHDNLIIVYDGPGLFSSARVWWTFKIMGAQDVRILKGGFDQWKSSQYPVETGSPNPPRARLFEANFDADQVASRDDVLAAGNDQQALILDARAYERFTGEAPEPREGMRSGHIPGSASLHYEKLLDENGFMKSPEALETIFADLDISHDRPIITSCGSGVTAAIITLALLETGRGNVRLYDGSWAEWGLPDGPEIATGHAG